MVVAEATAKYVRTSSQKAGLVLDLIRGKNVNLALSALQFSRKAVARDVAKVLRSAVANAQQQEAFGGDVARLFVSKCHADNGPSIGVTTSTVNPSRFPRSRSLSQSPSARRPK